MLYTLLVLLYVVVSVFLILVVLLQTGKRADLAGAFGGGGSQTALGTRGAADLLTKLTTVSAVLFMVVALTLSIMTSKRAGGSGSVLDEVPATPSAPAPMDTSSGAPSEGVAPAVGEEQGGDENPAVEQDSPGTEDTLGTDDTPEPEEPTGSS
jgi:preprotein translocase subunit SecG